MQLIDTWESAVELCKQSILCATVITTKYLWGSKFAAYEVVNDAESVYQYLWY